MIRRDMVIDPDRPHYYSQFWVDVASGKNPAPAIADSDGDVDALAALSSTNLLDTDLDTDLDAVEASEVAEPVVPVAPTRSAPSKKTEPKKAEPKKAESITSLADLAKIDMMMKNSAEMDSDTIPDIEGAVSAPDSADIITDFDLDKAEPEVEEPLDELEPEYGSDEYDEEDDWGESENEPRRGSKPNKRRDTRRQTRPDF